MPAKGCVYQLIDYRSKEKWFGISHHLLVDNLADNISRHFISACRKKKGQFYQFLREQGLARFRIKVLFRSDNAADLEASLVAVKNNRPRILKKVVCLNNGRIFHSARAAAKALKLSASHVRRTCRTPGARVKHLRLEYLDKSPPLRFDNVGSSKPVLCLTTGVVYPSAAAAARALGLWSSSVTKVCRGKRRHTLGLGFAYANRAPNGGGYKAFKQENPPSPPASMLPPPRASFPVAAEPPPQASFPVAAEPPPQASFPVAAEPPPQASFPVAAEPPPQASFPVAAEPPPASIFPRRS